MDGQLESRKLYLDNLSRSEIQCLAKKYPGIKGNWSTSIIIERLLDPQFSVAIPPAYVLLPSRVSAGQNSELVTATSRRISSPSPLLTKRKISEPPEDEPPRKRRHSASLQVDLHEYTRSPSNILILEEGETALAAPLIVAPQLMALPSASALSEPEPGNKTRPQQPNSASSDAYVNRHCAPRNYACRGDQPAASGSKARRSSGLPLTEATTLLSSRGAGDAYQHSIDSDTNRNGKRLRVDSEDINATQLASPTRRKFDSMATNEDTVSHAASETSVRATGKGKTKMTIAELEVWYLESPQRIPQQLEDDCEDSKRAQQLASEEIARRLQFETDEEIKPGRALAGYMQPQAEADGTTSDLEDLERAQRLARDEEYARALELEEEEAEQQLEAQEMASAVQTIGQVRARLGSERFLDSLEIMLNIEEEARFARMALGVHTNHLLDHLCAMAADAESRPAFDWLMVTLGHRLPSL